MHREHDIFFKHRQKQGGFISDPKFRIRNGNVGHEFWTFFPKTRVGGHRPFGALRIFIENDEDRLPPSPNKIFNVTWSKSVSSSILSAMETSWLEVTLAPTIMVSTASNSLIEIYIPSYASFPYLFGYAAVPIKIIHGKCELELFRPWLELVGLSLASPLPGRLESGKQSQKASEIHLSSTVSNWTPVWLILHPGSFL